MILDDLLKVLAVAQPPDSEAIGTVDITSNMLDAFRGNDWRIVEAVLPQIERGGMWPQVAAALLSFSYVHPSICSGFHILWTERGHRIREQVADDAALADALRRVLPNYSGPPLQLYRGENGSRWTSGRLGFAWTTQRATAEMFASGLNAMAEGGGVLLSTSAQANAIIAGPSAHSLYLGEEEYVVDPRLLVDIEAIAAFPQH